MLKSARAARERTTVERIVDWYFADIYGVIEGREVLPFYCDRAKVGQFAVDREALSAGTASSLFKLFVTLTQYQGIRDTVVMRRQLSLSRDDVQSVADLLIVSESVERVRCDALSSDAALRKLCRVEKKHAVVDCSVHPGLDCPVKSASRVFNRMGDMGILPASAWLLIWQRGLGVLLDDLKRHLSPVARADALVAEFARVHRVGRKLATMFVSALCTPTLAPGLTPWYPLVDGNALVVVDTNVARAIEIISEGRCGRSYEAQARWVRDVAEMIDLSAYGGEVPSYSPRVVQQAIYRYTSGSNRRASNDPCSESVGPCRTCVRGLCPFA